MIEKRRVHILLWPFWALWRLVLKVFELTGRLVGAILGLVFMVAGIVLTVTVFGPIIGIPLIVFGFMLSLRSLF